MTEPDDPAATTAGRDPEMAKELSLTGPNELSVKHWILLRGNRLVLSGIILAGVFVALLAANLLWPFGFLDLLTEQDTVETLFNTLLSGTILLVSVVVSINSIVLSQDLTSLDTQMTRVDSAMEFQENVEEAVGVDTCPSEPAAFIRLMLQSILDSVGELREMQSDHPNAGNDDRLQSYTHFLAGYTNVVAERMEDVDPGSIDVLIVGLTYDYAGAIHATRMMRTEKRSTLSEAEDEALAELVETLRLFAVSHEYFKSLFYMREFGKLSKSLLYVSLPVIVFISYVMLGVSAGQYFPTPVPFFPAATASITTAYTVALAPYVLLTAFVLRSATIATRSLASGPFVLSRERW